MPRSRTKPKSSTTTTTVTPSEPTASSKIQTVYAFPYYQYASLLGTYVLLVSFAALALPSSSRWLGFKPLPQTSSNDRPQHPWLNPITSNPAGSIVTLSVGVAGVGVWWSGWVRLWWANEKKLRRIENHTDRVQEKMHVRRNRYVPGLRMTKLS